MSVRAFIQRHPLAGYFILAFLITWSGCLLAVGPKFLRNEAIQLMDGMLMLASMLAGPSVAGIACTAIVDGRSGLRDLFSRMRRWRVGVQWYAASLLIPPILILAVLWTLSRLISNAYAPGYTPKLVIGGLLAGYFEEIGWTGFVTPRMKSLSSALAAGIALGLVWGVWHVAADYLGAARTYGIYWLPRFVSMWIVGMAALRVLIVWVYLNTNSILLAQLMHASSTGFLLVLSPSASSPPNEALWFAVYAAGLWVVAVIVIATHGRSLIRQSKTSRKGA